MAKRQQSKTMQSKEMSGTRDRSDMSKSSAKGSNNRRSAARVADNPEEQMQSAMPSDDAGQRKGRSASSNQRSGVRGKTTEAKSKTKAPSRTRAAR